VSKTLKDSPICVAPQAAWARGPDGGVFTVRLPPPAGRRGRPVAPRRGCQARFPRGSDCGVLQTSNDVCDEASACDTPASCTCGGRGRIAQTGVLQRVTANRDGCPLAPPMENFWCETHVEIENSQPHLVPPRRWPNCCTADDHVGSRAVFWCGRSAAGHQPAFRGLVPCQLRIFARRKLSTFLRGAPCSRCSCATGRKSNLTTNLGVCAAARGGAFPPTVRR